MNMKQTTTKACDGIAVITVTNGNPNGDPAEGGAPRRNSHNSLGLISGECTKRKVRDHVDMVYGQEPGYDLFVRRGAIHEPQIQEAYEKAKALDPKKPAKGNAELIQRYFDVRWFGLVVTNPGAGRIHGPISVNMGESVFPLVLEPYTGTRCTTTTKARSDQQQGRNQEFVNRYFVTFGVYTITWHSDPFRGDKQGFTQQDLDRFIEALTTMYRNDEYA